MSQQPGDGPKPFGGFESAPETPDENRAGENRPGEGAPPREVKRAMVVQTIIAAIMVFFGVFYLAQTESLTGDLMRELTRLDNPAVADISVAQLAGVVRVAAVMLLVLGLGHGLAAQGLHSRKTWARPVGFVFSGVMVAITIMSFFSGTASYPILIMGLLGAWSIVLIGRPRVKTYLSKK